MIKLIKNLRSAIYTLLIPKDSTNKVTQIINDRAFYYEAFEGTSLPYVVFYLLPILPSRDSATEFYEINVTFLCAANSLKECDDLLDAVAHVCKNMQMHFNTKIIEYKTIMVDVKPLLAPSKIEGVWQGNLQYKIILQT